MSNTDGIEFCDKCGGAIGRHDMRIIVTSNDKTYCFKNNCGHSVPEEETVIFDGFPDFIFCHKCGGIIPEERRALDEDGKYFCSNECERGTCICCNCKREIKEHELYFPIKQKNN